MVRDVSIASSDVAGKDLRIDGVGKELGSATTEDGQCSIDMSASNLVVANPRLCVVDASRLFKDIAAVDPLGIWAQAIFCDGHGRTEPIQNVCVSMSSVEDKHPVVRVLPSRDTLAVEPSIVASTSELFAWLGVWALENR